MSESDDFIVAAVVRVTEDPPPEPSDPGVEEQAWWPGRRRTQVEELKLDVGELQRSLDDVTSKLERVLSNQKQRTIAGFALESFTVGLTITAGGKVAFIAEAGLEASIELTFTRASADQVG